MVFDKAKKNALIKKLKGERAKFQEFVNQVDSMGVEELRKTSLMCVDYVQQIIGFSIANNLDNQLSLEQLKHYEENLEVVYDPIKNEQNKNQLVKITKVALGMVFKVIDALVGANE